MMKLIIENWRKFLIAEAESAPAERAQDNRQGQEDKKQKDEEAEKKFSHRFYQLEADELTSRKSSGEM